MSELHRLVYTSGRMKHCDEAEIQKILEACKKNNAPKNITGVLIHTDKRFIQVIEGDKKDVMELYEKVKKDDRHAGVSLRSSSPVTSRAFPDWHMGYKNISKSSIDFNTDISKKDVDLYNEILEEKGDVKDQDGMRVLKLFMKIS